MSTLVLTENFGILLGFTFGQIYSFHTTPLIVIAVIALFAILIYFFPETPTFLVKQNNITVSELKSINQSIIYKKNTISIVGCRKQKIRFDSIKICAKRTIKMTNLSNWK